MKRRDLIKLKRKSKETNYSLIKRESKMRGLLRTIQRVSKKRRRSERLLNKSKRRLESADLRIFFSSLKTFMRKIAPLINSFRNSLQSWKSSTLRLMRPRSRSRPLVYRVPLKRMRKDEWKKKSSRKESKKRSRSRNSSTFSSRSPRRLQDR